MTRRFISFPIADLQQTKVQMLNWCNRFNICCLLDNHSYHLSHNSIECLLAAGSLDKIEAQAGNSLHQLSGFHTRHNDWMFGHLSYDLKNETEVLSSNNPDGIGFPDLFFFVPEYVLQLKESSLSIGTTGNDHEEVFKEITSFKTEEKNNYRIYKI